MKIVTLLIIMLASVGTGAANPYKHNRAPDAPPSLQVPAGYKVSSHVYAIGVQIYTAMPSPTDPTKLVWTFTAPEAVLFDFDGEIVGMHYAYAGPTRPAWESASGSIVVGARTIPPVTVDPDAIPWLLLDAVETSGPGIFSRTALIQRVNTTGGLAPATPPLHYLEQVRIPYTAEYVFYRAHR